MLADKMVKVFGLEIPYFDYPEVEEREELEVLSARAMTEKLGDSRQKYEALRIFAKVRIDKELPAWRSQIFNETYRPYFNENYPEVEEAANTLLQPFYREVEIKKARRQAEALQAAGDAKALSAIIQAIDLTLVPFRKALATLESTGSRSN